ARSLTTRTPVDPRPTTMMWSRIWRARRRPAVWTKRRDSSRSATSATRMAVMVTPANINPMAKYRSQADCCAKLKSPKPTLVIPSEVKYKESSHDIRGFTKVDRITAVEPNISTSVNITDGKSNGLASSRMARTASMTRRTLDWLERVAVDGGTV